MVEKLKKKVEPVAATPAKAKAIPKKTTTIIAKCDCINEYQDKLYGKNMRAKNSTGSGLRCTVCRK